MSNVNPIPGVRPPASPGQIGLPERARAADGADFGNAVTRALDDLAAAHRHVDQTSLAAATGRLESVESHLIAMAEANLATQLTVAVRNRAIEAFNEIMRMQV